MTMQDDLACLERLILQKRQEIASTRAEIERTKSLAAPIRSIPHEILLHIFSLVDAPYYNALHPGQPPCSFGHVCKFWRTLSRTSPSLWSRVTVWNSAEKGFVNLLEQHLVLSNPCPLDVKLSFVSPDSDDAMDVVVNALSGHSIRLQHLQFDGGPYETECFFDMLSNADLRLLQCLKVHAFSPFPALQEYDIVLPASLRSLDMNLPFSAFNSIQGQWQRLTSFSGLFSGAASFHRFIVDAENLAHLRISCIGDDDEHSETKTVIVHENINHLTLDPSCSMSLALDNISLPHLENLVLDENAGPHDHSTCPVQPRQSYHAVLCRLLNRSQCALNSFVGGIYLEPQVLTLILGMSTIRCLQLHLGDEVNLSLSEVSTLLESLTITPSQQPLPRLRELAITCVMEEDHLFVNSRLHDLVASRWTVTGDVSRLSKLTLENYIRPEVPQIAYETSTLAAFLLELKDQGLDVLWRIDGSQDVLADAKKAVDSYL